MQSAWFKWAGLEWRLIADISTGEWYRFVIAVDLPLRQAPSRDRTLDAIKAAAVFASRYIAPRGLDSVSPEAVLEAAMQGTARVWPDLTDRMLERAGLGPLGAPVLEYYRVVFDALEYKPGEAGPCDCLECIGVEVDPDCLFKQNGQTPASRKLGAISPELVNEYWDRPLYLYEHAKAKREAEAEGYGVIRQKREAVEERHEQNARLDARLSHIPRI